MAELLPRKSCLIKASISPEKTELCREWAVHAPRVLDYEAQVVAPGEPDSFLDVLWRSGIDADYWHTPLATRNPERGVEVAALDRPVGEGVCLVVAILSSARLIRAPDTGVPASEDISTVSCSRVVARGGRRDGGDQWLRDFGCEGLELGVGWPTSRSRCAATISRGCRCQTESDGQERREEKHHYPVGLGRLRGFIG